MFIDPRRNIGALRQEGHVSGEGSNAKIHIALLTEGVEARTLFYKHRPPDGGRRGSHSFL